MTILQLPDEVARMLGEMSRDVGISIDDIALEAIIERLEDWDDARIYDEARKNDDGTRYTLQEVMAKYASDPEAALDTGE